MRANTIPLTADEAIEQFFLRKPQKRTAIDLNDDLVYVLLLVDGKFYVGRSSQFRKRLNAHFYRKSAWTRKYPPIAVLDLIQPVEDFDEDKITLRYMNHFGVDNVRGGSFSSMDLDPNDVSVIDRMCSHARNECFLCGNKGHYARNCTVKRFEQYSTSLDRAIYRDALRRRHRQYKGSIRSRPPRNQRRADFDFDDSDEDYNSDDLYDYFYSDSDEFDEDGDDSEDSDEDSDEFDDDSDDFDDDTDDYDDYDRPPKRRRHTECSRCGRDGHTKSQCYARTDIYGREMQPRASTRRGQTKKTAASIASSSATAAAVAAAAVAVAAPALSSFTAARPPHAAEAATSLASRSSSTLCDRCGRTSHAIRCYATTSVDGHPLTAQSLPTRHQPPQAHGVSQTGSVGSQIAAIQPPSLLTSPSRAASLAPSERCSRCGRDNHTQSHCFAATSVDGRTLTAEPPATSRPELRLGNVPSQAATGMNPFHAAAAVAAHPSSWAPPLQPPQPSHTSQLTQPLHQSRPPQVSRPPPVPSVHCSRCGRDNHTHSRCFASTSVDGRALTTEPPSTSRPELRLGNVSSQAATGLSPFHAASAVAAHPSSWAPPLQPPQPSHTSQLTQPLHQSRPPQVSRPPPGPSVRCSRCGRDSHTRSECFASNHISGRYLY